MLKAQTMTIKRFFEPHRNSTGRQTKNHGETKTEAEQRPFQTVHGIQFPQALGTFDNVQLNLVKQVDEIMAELAGKTGTTAANARRIVIVRAVAGAGKTRCCQLSSFVANHRLDCLPVPRAVYLTFNRSICAEMQQKRADHLVHQSMEVNTFHSYARNMLVESGVLSSRHIVVEDNSAACARVRRCIEEILEADRAAREERQKRMHTRKRKAASEPNFPIKCCTDYVYKLCEKVKEQHPGTLRVDYSQVSKINRKYLHSERCRIARDALRAHEIELAPLVETCLSKNLHDAMHGGTVSIGDCLWLPTVSSMFLAPFLDRPVGCLLVDEMQDIDPLMLFLVTKIVHRDGLLMLLGDERQGINEWKGALPVNKMLHVLAEAGFCKRKFLSLPCSYRLPKSGTKYVNHCFRIHKLVPLTRKTTKTTNTLNNEEDYYEDDNNNEEDSADIIDSRHDAIDGIVVEEKGDEDISSYPFINNTTVLARYNRDIHALTNTLHFRTIIVNDSDNNDDSNSNSSNSGSSNDAVIKETTICHVDNEPLTKMVIAYVNELIEYYDPPTLHELTLILEEHRLKEEYAIGKRMDDDFHDVEDPRDLLKGLGRRDELTRRAIQWSGMDANTSVHDFLDFLRMPVEANFDRVVNLYFSTVHKFKGCEANCVLVYDWNGILEAAKRSIAYLERGNNTADHSLEDINILYTALTRHKERLVLYNKGSCTSAIGACSATARAPFDP